MSLLTEDTSRIDKCAKQMETNWKASRRCGYYGKILVEITEFGLLVAIRSSVFSVPWNGSVRVGSEMC